MTITLTEAERERVARAMLDEMRRQGEEEPATRWGWLDDDNLTSVVIDWKPDMLKVAEATAAEVGSILAEREKMVGARMMERLKEIAAQPGYRESVRRDLEQWLAENAADRAEARSGEITGTPPQPSGTP